MSRHQSRHHREGNPRRERKPSREAEEKSKVAEAKKKAVEGPLTRCKTPWAARPRACPLLEEMTKEEGLSIRCRTQWAA
jgi:hypothetical protein